MAVDSLQVIQENKVQNTAIRKNIIEFEKLLSTIPGAEFGDNPRCPLKHSFAPGMCVREIFLPKGSIIVGKIHKHAHPNFLLSGEVIVITESGGKEHLKAPMSMISPAGTKRVLYVIEDTTWAVVHATNETDVSKIEEDVICKSYEEYDKFIEDSLKLIELEA